MQFAEKTYVPFGYLFLTQPPEEVLPIPDLRTLEGQDVTRPSTAGTPSSDMADDSDSVIDDPWKGLLGDD